jgi:diguanylate cyclase (GGDEF)-like protein/PAS domain S-box-containing protein
VALFRATNDGELAAEMSEVRADLHEALAQLGTVNADLVTANAQLGTANAQLGTANAQLATANEELATANTELATANEELALRQSFADALLETVEVGIVSCDADGGNVLRNRAERVRVGLDAGSQGLMHEPAAALIDVLDPDGVRLPIERYPLLRALRGEQFDAVELLVGPAGGPHREVVTHSAQILDPAGVVLGAVSALTDISTERAALRELADERRLLLEAQRLAKLGSFTYNVTDRTFTYSEQLLLTWGLSAEVAESIDVVSLADSFVHVDDRAFIAEIWRRVLDEGGHAQYEHRIVRPNGVIRHLRTNIELVAGTSSVPAALHGTQHDVTELVVAEQSAKRANAFLDAVLSATPDYTFVNDVASGVIVYRSRDVDVLGMTSDELQALDTDARLGLVHPNDQARLVTVNTDAAELDDGQVLQLRYRGLHADGEWRWLSRRVTPFRRDNSGTVTEVLAVLRDVTDVVEAEDLLMHGALHDALTGLPNRVLLIDRLNSALARSARDGREVAVLFCDLDGFKRVNETGGHAAGDAVLLEIAERLRGGLRDGDTVARVGGDEFVVIVEPWNRTSPHEQPGAVGLDALPDRFLAVRVAERVIEAVRPPITINGVSHVVTVSIGITYARLAPNEHSDHAAADQVLQDSDAAMYRAKTRGKDRFALFESGLRTDLAERGRVEQILRRALRSLTGQPMSGAAEISPSSTPTLSAAYQPIFDSGTGALVGFEALARLTDDKGVNIPPDVFIAVAEETGTIHTVGAVMLDLACGQLQSWRAQMPGLERVSMAVNVSALQAQEIELVGGVRLVLAARGLEPVDLVLELTETALLQAAPSTITILRALHSDGVGIAIDDFGTGYASLRYLATLPVTAIKIDRSFTSGLPHDETSRKIVKALAGLAADLDLGCIVEGVETAEQRAALPDGVQLQGWLTGRPGAPAALDLQHLVTVGAPPPPAPPPASESGPLPGPLPGNDHGSVIISP